MIRLVHFELVIALISFLDPPRFISGRVEDIPLINNRHCDHYASSTVMIKLSVEAHRSKKDEPIIARCPAAKKEFAGIALPLCVLCVVVLCGMYLAVLSRAVVVDVVPLRLLHLGRRLWT